MTRLDRLKIELIKYNRSRSITKAVDICEWLCKELIREPKKIEVKEG